MQLPKPRYSVRQFLDLHALDRMIRDPKFRKGRSLSAMYGQITTAIGCLGDVFMPQNAKSDKFDYRETKFASVRLSSDELAKFDTWYEKSFPDFWELLTVHLSAGWKLSVTWDKENDCFIASSTNHAEKSVNYRTCVTSRDNEWFGAVMMNVFKCHVLYDDEAIPVNGKGFQRG